MTKRSSFVMPPDLVDVAVIGNFWIPPRIIKAKLAPCAELGRIKPWASLHGNIAAKPLPIRLLALCAAMSGSCEHSKDRMLRQWHLLRRTNPRGLTALPRGNIARLHEIAHQETIVEKELAWRAFRKRSRVCRKPLARNGSRNK